MATLVGLIPGFASTGTYGDTSPQLLVWGISSACYYGMCDVPDDLGTTMNPVVEVALGDDHGIARLHDGSIVCWGRNNEGQCDIPAGIGPPDSPVIQVAADRDRTYALLEDGSLHCWGGGTATFPPTSGRLNLPSRNW